MAEAYIIDACRTPRGIGKQGKGALAHLHPQHLGSTVLKALAERNDLNTAEVDDIVWGTSSQVSEQSGDLGRMAALDAGYDTKASGVTLDRFCGSGITATNIAATSVMAGMEDLVIAGGTEMMSLPKKGLLPMGANNLHLRELHPQSHQGVCADAIATLDGIPRSALDEHAAESQAKAEVAIKEGRFDRSLVPVLNLDGTVALDHEEFPRPGTTAESLAQLTPSFGPLADYRHPGNDGDNPTFRELINMKFPDLEIEHVHHAGNSSGVVDGAAAILIASEQYAKANGMTPRARVVACANMGDDPTLMLNAPVPAAEKVLARAGMTVDDIDLFEINEAFAVVSEKFMRLLDLDRDKVNVQRWCHGPRSPDRGHRRHPDRYPARRVGAPGQAVRPGHDVRGRRHGPGRHHRAGLSRSMPGREAAPEVDAVVVDAVVVGAGFSGLYLCHRLVTEGFSVRVFEAGGGVGGTWYWNRYPGARCDIESVQYSFQFSEELQQEWTWSERYASQPELLAYIEHVADRFDLRRHITFDTRVERARFDDDTHTWTVSTCSGDGSTEAVTARFVLLGVGVLSTTSTPDFPGLDTYRGRTFHTGTWPHEPVDFSGERVGVIGTGSSGIQSIPILADEAEHLYVFQRTPNYVIPARNRPLEADEVAAIKASYPELRARARERPTGFLFDFNPGSIHRRDARGT